MDRPNNPTVGLVTSKGWTLESVVASGPRFRTVDKTSADSATPEQIASTIKDYEQRGVPLVVQDLHGRSDWPEFFTPQWLETHYGSQSAPTPELSIQTTGFNFSCPSGRSPQCSWRKASQAIVHHGVHRQHAKYPAVRPSRRYDTPLLHLHLQPIFLLERERLYGKDMPCPPEWRNWIKTSGVLPDAIIPGAIGDVLPETVETLMSYLGVSDTCMQSCLCGPVYRFLTPTPQSRHGIRTLAHLTGKTSCATLRVGALRSGS